MSDPSDPKLPHRRPLVPPFRAPVPASGATLRPGRAPRLGVTPVPTDSQTPPVAATSGTRIRMRRDAALSLVANKPPAPRGPVEPALGAPVSGPASTDAEQTAAMARSQERAADALARLAEQVRAGTVRLPAPLPETVSEVGVLAATLAALVVGPIR